MSDEQTNQVNTVNHSTYFNPAIAGRIDVVGCGAIGSRVVLELARTGVEDIHVHDFDTVEAKNISNQAFGIQHVGMLKVDAIRQIVKEYTGLEITTHNHKVTGVEAAEFGETAILVPDTIPARIEIWQDGIMMNPLTRLIIDARMLSVSGRVFCIDREVPDDLKLWTDTLAAQQKGTVIVSECGTVVNIGATAGLAASIVTALYIRAMKKFCGEDIIDQPEIDVAFSVDPMSMNVFPVPEQVVLGSSSDCAEPSA